MGVQRAQPREWKVVSEALLWKVLLTLQNLGPSHSTRPGTKYSVCLGPYVRTSPDASMYDLRILRSWPLEGQQLGGQQALHTFYYLESRGAAIS